jgi:predicted metal-binding protein
MELAMADRNQFDALIKARGFADFRYINPQKDIVMAEWTHFHCFFGCPNYGKSGTCPPAIPPLDVCRRMVDEYTRAVILHFTREGGVPNNDRDMMLKLAALERDFFKYGCYKAFLLEFGPCALCDKCAAEGTRIKCVDKVNSRPGADALGIDVFQTVRNAGYEIQTLKDKTETENRFAILLIE